MKTNQKASRAPVSMKTTSYDILRRTCMAALLFEGTFYEDGESIADRITRYMKDLSPEQARSLLKEAKVDNKLRHVPLLLLTCMAKNGQLTSDDVAKTITRVDDMAELIAIYQSNSDNKHMIPHSIQKGMAKAFPKFDEYQLAKYKGNKDAIKLRDVIRLAHPKPVNEEQSLLWKKVVDGNLATPDTWEVALSSTKDKKAEWTRLLTTKTEDGYNKLGALALIRNLRGMQNAGVNDATIREAVKSASVGKLLPFQFVTAARMNPSLGDVLEDKFFESMENVEKLKGSTLLLVDDSGSMDSPLSTRSETKRQDVAGALAAITRATCDKDGEVKLYAFTQTLNEIPSHLKGFALASYFRGSGGTAVIDCTNKAIENFKNSHDGKYPDRVIVITDEQDNSSYSRSKIANLPKGTRGYFVNVAPYEKGIAYNKSSGWTTISGWSDSLIKYIAKVESSNIQ